MSRRQIQKLQKQELKEEESEEEEKIAHKPSLFNLLNQEEETTEPTQSEPIQLEPIVKIKIKKNRFEFNEDLEVFTEPVVVKQSYTHLLVINPKALDYNLEIKSQFGSRVFNANQSSSKKKFIKKTFLATPDDTWPRLLKNGIDMTVEDGLHSFTHSKSYSQTQIKFIRAISTHDPEQLTAIIRNDPYHIDTLLQLSQVASHNGDLTQAGNLIDRALYAFEKSFTNGFGVSSSSKLDFRRIENRPFYLALFRHVQFVARKGCWKTCFELCKFIYSLDLSDPMGILYQIDYYAIRSGNYEWVIQFINDNQFLLNLVNWNYSLSLAKFLNGDTLESESLLKSAFLKFPQLASKFSLSSTKFFSSLDFPINHPLGFISAQTDLYYVRDKSLFENETLSWFTNVFQSIDLNSFKLGDPVFQAIPLNFSRNVYLSELNASIQNLPLSSLNLEFHGYDPMPPIDAIPSIYDSRRTIDGSILGAFLGTLMPWTGVDDGLIEPEIEEEGRRRRPRRNFEQVAGDQLPGVFPEGMIEAIGGAENAPIFFQALRDAFANLFVGAEAEREIDNQEED